MGHFEQNLLKSKPLMQKVEGGYAIRYITEDIINPFFGYALEGKVFIRKGLPKRVEQFVIAHEKYHLNDTHDWLGWIGAESRANVHCGLRDPVGLISTIFISIKSGRLSTYWHMLRTAGKKLP